MDCFTLIIERIYMYNILDIFPVGIFILDKNFYIRSVNKVIEKFFGIPREEMLGRDKRKLIIKRIAFIWEDHEGFARRILAAYDSNNYVQNFISHVIPCPHREERWLSHFSEPINSGYYKGGRVEIYTDVTNQIVAEKHINWLSSQIIHLQEKEKSRIARDLHDELGQQLVVQKMILENLANQLNSQDICELKRRLHCVIKDLGRLSGEVQRIAGDLMPSSLEPLGLHETLIWLKERTQELYRLQIDYQALGLGERRLPRPLEVTIFRIFQEGLNNIIKHAKAEHVELKLIYSYPQLIISIQDDGVGFSQKDPHSGLGLRFMRQRVSEVGGNLRIKSVPGKGTTLRLEIPYYQNAH